MHQFIRGKTQYYKTLFSPESVEEFLSKNTIKAPIMCGRSNVGKSTFVNALFRNNIARASKTPGKTREIQVFTTEITEVPDEKFFIFDLPGYGHARVSKEERKRWDELMHYFFTHLPPGQLIVHILDSNNPTQKNDQEFRDFMKSLPFQYWAIFNKTDKLKTQKEKNKFKGIVKELSFHKSFNISALKKRNIEKVEQELIQFFLNE